MKRLKVSTSGFGLIVLAVVLIALGGLSIYSTRRFLAGAERVMGTIFYSQENETNTLLVRVPNPDGITGRIFPVRAAWWTPPWQYLRDETVTILYDPRGDYEAPLWPDRAFIDSWAQLYLTAVLSIVLGLLAAAAAVFSRTRRAHVSVSLGIDAD